MPDDRKNPKTIAREEWDFDPHADGYAGCPDDEIQFAFVYEFARASPPKRNDVAECRKAGKWPDLFNNENVYWMRGLPHLNFIASFPEFPDTPWLAIDGTLRSGRIKSLPEYDPPISMVEIGETEAAEFIWKTWNPRERFTVDVLKINWAYSDQQLGEALARFRPEDFPSEQIHARTSERESLRKLGAKRLIDAFGSLENAKRHTKGILQDDVTGNPRPLYESDKGWRRAAAEAEALICGERPQIPALKLIDKVGLKHFSPDELNKFFPWIGSAKPKVIKELLELHVGPCIERIRSILKDL